MNPAKLLKEKVDRGEITTGALATNHVWVGLVEVLLKAGLDYLIVDQEHGPHNNELVADVCLAGRISDFPVLIRPIDCGYSTIRQTIDRGPCGFLLPCIGSAADLDQVQDAIHMPPRGSRRPGGLGNYWVSDYGYESWKREVEDDFIVLPQIETLAGLDNVEEIAAHSLTTAIAIGPYDLSAELGVCGEMEHPLMAEAGEQIRQAGEKAGKTMWRIGDGRQLVKAGFHFLCIGESTMVMQSALEQKNEEAKSVEAR